ncbi:MAG: hypothetical protein RL375_1401 [Pseudomonadota bacterium]
MGGVILLSCLAWWLPCVRAFVLAAGLLALSPVPAVAQPAAEIRVGGSGAAQGTMNLLAQAYTRAQPGMRVTVLPGLDSGGGIKALLAGALHLAVSARDLTSAESQAGAVAVELGRTPVVWATAAGHVVPGLTTQQLVDIYAGSRAVWPDGSKLRLVLRPSTDSEVLRQLSSAMRDALAIAEQRKGTVVALTDQEAARDIESIPGALGPTTLALILSENRALQALALDGVMPTAQTIAAGTYPLHIGLSVVTGPATSAQAQEFVAFLRSPQAAEILQRTGHWLK